MIQESIYKRADLPLTTAVVVGGRALHRINIRMPTCGDLALLGSPVDKADGEWRATDAVWDFLPVLAGVEGDALSALTRPDLIRCGELLVSMFAWMTAYVLLFRRDNRPLVAANER